MNIIKHHDCLPIINSAEYIAHNMTTEEFEELDATCILLQAIETVDNCVDIVVAIELAITAHGYEIRYELVPGTSYGDYEILADLERALEMVREDHLYLLED